MKTKSRKLSLVDGSILAQKEPYEDMGPNVTVGTVIIPDSGINEGETVLFQTQSAVPISYKGKQYYIVEVGDILGKLV